MNDQQNLSRGEVSPPLSQLDFLASRLENANSQELVEIATEAAREARSFTLLARWARLKGEILEFESGANQ